MAESTFDYEGLYGGPMKALQRSSWAPRTTVARGEEGRFGELVLIPGGRFYPPAEPDAAGPGYTLDGFILLANSYGMQVSRDDFGIFVKWPDPPKPREGGEDEG